MKIEWYKDGRYITSIWRIATIYNFGYFSLFFFFFFLLKM